MSRLPRVSRVAGLACLALTLSIPAGAALTPPQRITLANGLRVVLAPDSLSSAVDLSVAYPAGTRFERPGRGGISHLIERLSFRGSAAVGDGEHRRRLLAEGGTVNTQATSDHLVFWQTLPAEALALALALEADRMSGLKFTPAAFEAERREAAGDRARAERTPVAQGIARLWALAYAGHPYARPLAGEPGEVMALTAAEVDRWRRERLSPSQAVLTVVGRFDPGATLTRIRELFERLPAGTRPRDASLPWRPGTAATWREPSAVPVRVRIEGWRGPGAQDPDLPAIELLARILGGNQEGRLPTALVGEWELAIAVQTGLDVRREGSLLWSFVALRDGADTTTVERVTRETLAAVARDGVTDEVFDHARRTLLNVERFALQGVRARAQTLAAAEMLLGDATLATRRLERIERLTAADVQRVAQRLLSEPPHAVVWLDPASPTGGAGR